MKTLFVMDKKDYSEEWEHSVRTAARAIILKEGMLAMAYSRRDSYYKFPGGGAKEGEDILAALTREVAEEIGLTVIPSSIREFGRVTELRKSDMFGNTVFEQVSLYYLCETDGSLAEQSLDSYEAAAGFELRYVTPKEAAEANRLHNVDFLKRETRVLEMLGNSKNKPSQ